MKHPELDALQNIKVIAMDVDGVLTDGTVHVTEEGQELRRMNMRDGYAIVKALKEGIQFIVISGGRSEGVRHRLERLGIERVHLGVSEKLPLLENQLEDMGLHLEDCLYIGDDIPDLECLKASRLAACPDDAAWEVVEASHFQTAAGGGQGCVRELVEQCLRAQGKWGL